MLAAAVLLRRLRTSHWPSRLPYVLLPIARILPVFLLSFLLSFLPIACTLIAWTVLCSASRSRSSVLVFRDVRWVFVRMPAWPLAGTQIEKQQLPSQTMHLHLLQTVHGTLSFPISFAGSSMPSYQLTIHHLWSPFFHYYIVYLKHQYYVSTSLLITPLEFAALSLDLNKGDDVVSLYI